MSRSVPGWIGRLALVLLGAALAILVLVRVGQPADCATTATQAFVLVLGASLAAGELVLVAWAIGARLEAVPATACFLWLLAAAGLWFLLGMPALVLSGMDPRASGALVDLLGPRAAGILGYGLVGLLLLLLPAGAVLASGRDLLRWRGHALAVALWAAAVAALALSRAREPRWLPLEAGPPSAGPSALAQVPAFPAALPLAALAAAAGGIASVRLARRSSA